MIDAPLRVAIIGDRGIPARYSGFSTLVEEISTRLVSSHGMDVTVYCRTQYFDTRPSEFKGVNLIYLRAPGGKSFESMLHSARAIWHAALRPFDVVFIVDPGNGPFSWPLVLTRKPFAIHTDGKGWQRTKWSRLQRKYYKWSEWWTARFATWLVTDSPSMRAYYVDEYHAPSSYIPYGSGVGGPPDIRILEELGLQPGSYHLVVARLEPENNVDHIIREYKASHAQMPLVYVGNARYESAYSRSVMGSNDARVRCVGAIYNAEKLNGLYHHCRTYLHGHEVGGTNPSLLRAMGAGAACLPIDVIYHREVLGPNGRYFSKAPGHLSRLIEEFENNDEEVNRLSLLASQRAESCYRWDAVAAAYARMFTLLADCPGNTRQLVSEEVYNPAKFARDARPT